MLVEEIPLPGESELGNQTLDCDPDSGEASCTNDLLCKENASLLAEKLSDVVKMGSSAENVSSASVTEETSDACGETGHVAQSRDSLMEEVEGESTKDAVGAEGEVSTTEDNLGKCGFRCYKFSLF